MPLTEGRRRFPVAKQRLAGLGRPLSIRYHPAAYPACRTAAATTYLRPGVFLCSQLSEDGERVAASGAMCSPSACPYGVHIAVKPANAGQSCLADSLAGSYSAGAQGVLHSTCSGR